MKKPYPFQEEAIQRCLESSQLVGDECGLGKTLEAIETVRRLRDKGKPFDRPILVLTRKNSSLFWEDEIRGQGIDDKVIVLGTAGTGLPEEVKSENWIITHHEALQWIGDRLMRVPWSVVIVDECHRFKNRKTKGTHILHKIPAARRLGLSGTLLDKLPTDLWANLNWVAPSQFRSFWAMDAKYILTERDWRGYPHKVGLMPGMEKEFAEEIGPFVIQRTKEEVLPDLPPKIEQRVRVQMTDTQRAMYAKVRDADDILIDVDAADPLVITNVLARITRLQQIASDPMLLGLQATSAKLEWLSEYIEDNSNESIVIFTRFRELAVKIAYKLNAAYVVGGKESTLVRFQTGETQYVVGTIDAMGESLNLQKARTAIFVDQHWSSIAMAQAIERIHRADITEAKHIIYLMAEGSVDSLLMKTLDDKWNLQRMVREYLNGSRN